MAARRVWEQLNAFLLARLRAAGITPVIARRHTAHGSGLGRFRWAVERSFAWLHNFKRLLVRYERRADPPGLPRARLLPRLLSQAQELNVK
jgi:hypothetical protein